MAQFTIRIPDEMRDRIRQAAAEDKRPTSREVEWLLERGLEARAAELGRPGVVTLPADPPDGATLSVKMGAGADELTIAPSPSVTFRVPAEVPGPAEEEQ